MKLSTKIFSNTFSTLLAVTLLLFLAPLSLAKDPINTGWFSSVAIEGYDSVAYFTESKPVEGSSDFEYEWQGATWRFSSAENLALFKSDPEKYSPQYGGYCAYAVAIGKTAGIDPSQWSVVDGKLYLNYSKDIQEKWLSQRDSYIQQANANWPGVLD